MPVIACTQRRLGEERGSTMILVCRDIGIVRGAEIAMSSLHSLCKQTYIREFVWRRDRGCAERYTVDVAGV